MSKPLVTFPDPEAALVAYLTAEAPFYFETAPTVGVGFPASAPYDGHVQVELELGAADDYPITERAQVRVTCWVPSTAPAGSGISRRSQVKSLASMIQGLVYAHPGDSEVAGCRIQIGRSDVIKDPDTGYLMVWFLARVNLKATLLAS